MPPLSPAKRIHKLTNSLAKVLSIEKEKKKEKRKKHQGLEISISIDTENLFRCLYFDDSNSPYFRTDYDKIPDIEYEVIDLAWNDP